MHNLYQTSPTDFYVKGLTGVGQNCHRQHCKLKISEKSLGLPEMHEIST